MTSDYLVFGLVSSAPIASFHRHFTPDTTLQATEERFDGWLKWPLYEVLVTKSIFGGTWPGFATLGIGSDRVDLKILLDTQRIDVTDSTRAVADCTVLIDLIQRPDVEAGTFEDPEYFVWVAWSREAGVIVNSDPEAWNSATGRVVRQRLQEAKILYERRFIEPYNYELSLRDPGELEAAIAALTEDD